MKIDEILEQEVNIAKDIIKERGKMIQQFNFYKGSEVIPVIIQADKCDWSKVVFELLPKLRPDTIAFLSEGWMSSDHKEELKEDFKKVKHLKDFQKTNIPPPSQDPNAVSALIVSVWNKDEKRTFIGTITEDWNVEATVSKPDEFESRWDWIQKALGELDKLRVKLKEEGCKFKW